MKNRRLHLHDYIFTTAGILLFLTLLSVWLVCGLLARYTIQGSFSDGARVAGFGTLAVREHEAVAKAVSGSVTDIGSIYYGGDYDDMVYELNKDNEVESNTYSIMMPGVDIPKDPFVRIAPGEVSCELYIEVIEKDFPKGKNEEDLVTYEVDPDLWTKVENEKGPNGGDLYKYNMDIYAGSESEDIYILKGNKVYVSQYYDADTANKKNEEFSLTFNALMRQID